MKHQPPICQVPPKVTRTHFRAHSLLMLSAWMGLSGLIGQGALTRSTAAELVIPEAAASKPAPLPAAAVPERAAVVEPAAVEPAPQAIAPDPIPAAVPIPEPIAPAPAIQKDPTPRPQASDPYIDTKDYGIGATEPYTPPERIVVNERSSGCQATVASGQSISASLCAPPPASAASPYDPSVYASPYAPSSQTAEQPPEWATNRWAAPSGENGSAPAGASAQTIQSTLQYSAIPPQNLVVKPITGANPLKWILNGERMIFPLVIPVDITSIFGWRVHPITGEWRFHSGTDLGAPMGTPVLAAYSGRVSLADVLGGYGLSILLDHNQGQQETRYAHLSEIFVKPGQWVQQGTVIGLVGSTGNSTGPHLHFEALQATAGGMVAVDPGLELQTTLAQLAKALQTAHLTAQSKVKIDKKG